MTTTVKEYAPVKGYKIYRSTYETPDAYGYWVKRGMWFATKDGMYLPASTRKELESFISTVKPHNKVNEGLYERWGIR